MCGWTDGELAARAVGMLGFLIVNLILRKHGQGEAGGRANGRAGMRGQKDQGEEVRGELGGKGQTKRFVLVLFIWCAAANNALHLSDALPGSGVTTHEEKDTIIIQPNQIQTNTSV